MSGLTLGPGVDLARFCGSALPDFETELKGESWEEWEGGEGGQGGALLRHDVWSGLLYVSKGSLMSASSDIIQDILS